MKIDLEEVESMLLQKQIPPQKVQEIVSELEKVVEELKDENKTLSGPKLKWKHTIILNDKEGYLRGKEIAGWVVQTPEEDDENLVLSKLTDAAKSQNEVTKKKANRIDDLVSLFEHLKSKFTKEKKIRVKTKELSTVIISSGKLV